MKIANTNLINVIESHSAIEPSPLIAEERGLICKPIMRAWRHRPPHGGAKRPQRSRHQTRVRVNHIFATIVIAMLAPCLSPNLVAMNYSDACRILADKPFLPGAGETPSDYDNRVNAFKWEQAAIAELKRAQSEVMNLKATARKLSLQIQTGMLISGGKAQKSSVLNDEEKAEMLSELLTIQERITAKEARIRELSDALEQEEERLTEKEMRRATENAIDRQTQKILQEIRDGNLRHCR